MSWRLVRPSERLGLRPVAGKLIVPFVVDETRDPIDFKIMSADHIRICARQRKCGVCGHKIRGGLYGFVGPDDGRTCFADPWMHPDCALVAMQQCPFLGGRRDWRSVEARTDPLTERYSRGMRLSVCRSAEAWRGGLGEWHFHALTNLAKVLSS